MCLSGMSLCSLDQDTFTMPFPRKREGEAHRKRHQSLPEALIGAVDR